MTPYVSRTARPRAGRLFLAIVSGFLLASPGPVNAQTNALAGDVPLSARLHLVPAIDVSPGPLDSMESSLFPFQEEGVSPRGAFLRSLALPGWGHVAAGVPGRGAIYVAGQSGSLWMLWKSVARRGTARRSVELARETALARLERQGITDPAQLRARVEQDPVVEEWEDVIDNRDQQVEDWVAMSIFIVLMGAVDAYVTAHLRDFPEPLSFRMGTNPVNGQVEAGFSVFLGGKGPSSR